MTTLLNTGVRKFTVSVNEKIVDFLPRNIIKVDEKQAQLLLKYPDITEIKEQKVKTKQVLEKEKENKEKSEKND